MTQATLGGERGDDRRTDVEIERLHEMYEQPSYDGSVGYEADTHSDKHEAGIGDLLLEQSKTRYPRALGGLMLTRRAHIRPTQVSLGPENYLG